MLTIVAPSIAALPTLPITAIGSIGISSPVLRTIAWMRFTGFNGDNYMAILRENVYSTTNGKKGKADSKLEVTMMQWYKSIKTHNNYY